MLRVPGMTRAGGRSERFVSLQDVYPTLVELSGLEPPGYLDGRSLVPLLKNPNAAWKSTAISAHDDRHISIRTEQYRYIRYSDGEEEFYDHSKDPHEWTNQIGNPEYSHAIKNLRSRVPAQKEMLLQVRRKRK